MRLFIILTIVHTIQARDIFTINFIKSYVEYERISYVNIGKLDWPTDELLNLVKVLSNASVRSVSSNYEDPHTPSALFVVDLRLSGIEVFDNVTKYLRSPYRWLVFDDGNENKNLRELPLLLDSNFIVAVQTNLTYRLYELYKPFSKGVTISKNRGYFDGTLSDSRMRPEIFWSRCNLMGYPLVMSNVIEETNASKKLFVKDDRTDPHDSVSRVTWYASRLVFEMLNATPVHIFSYSYGRRYGDSWTAMTSDLATGRAELGTSCDMDVEKMDVLTFTDSVVSVDKKFIFRQPPLSYISNIYILVFSTRVWIAVAICAAIATVAIYLESKWEGIYYAKSSCELDGGISDSVFLTVCALSQQGCYMEPRRLSGRIIALVTFTSMMATYAAYSADIYVLLQAPSTAVTSLEQLAETQMALAAVDTEYNRNVLKQSANDRYRQKIYKKIAEKGKEKFRDLDVCVKNMRQGLYAFHGVLEPVYRRIEKTFLESEKCDLMEVDFVNGFDQYVPVTKNSPYLELFRVSFKRIRESGITAALNKRYLTQKPVCADQGSTFSNIGIINVRPVLALMGLGVAASVVLLGFEVVVHKVALLQEKKSSKSINISKKIKL